MGRCAHLGLRPEDVLAVALPPGPDWLDVVAEAWEAGAAVLPVDHRFPPAEAAALLDRAAPTVILDTEGARRADGATTEAEIALIVHTSGTGGAPKLVQFDRRAIDAAVAGSSLALEATPNDRWICCLPLAHVGGLLVLLRGLLLGAPVSVHARFDEASIAAEPEAAFISLVPTMLVRLLESEVDISNFRAVLVGGAHLSPDVRRLAERAGGRVVETYGLTETCGGVLHDGLPLPGTEIRISDEGGVELRGPTLMLGYRSDPDATTRAFTSDGWLRPGDAGELDAEGRLHVVGRVDDLINSGGEKVWPQEVEAVLRGHPKVAEVGVGGRLDPEWGQRVVAWVVPKDPADPPTLEDLRDHASARIPRHKAPRELILVRELPRTFSGKLRRGALAYAHRE